MRQLSHRVAAKADLIEIWDYTAAVWGILQADRYLTQIDEIARNLATGAMRGAMARTGYLKRKVGSHVIYYRESAEEIVIVRVLHNKMDAARHLPD